jgi:hypothetical protein
MYSVWAESTRVTVTNISAISNLYPGLNLKYKWGLHVGTFDEKEMGKNLTMDICNLKSLFNFIIALSKYITIVPDHDGDRRK